METTSDGVTPPTSSSNINYDNPAPICRRFSVSISSVADDIEEAAVNTDIAAATRRIEGNEDEILRDLRRSSLIVNVPADGENCHENVKNSTKDTTGRKSKRRDSNSGTGDGELSVVTVTENMNNENNEDSPNEDEKALQNENRRSSFTKRLSEVFNNSASSIKHAMEQIGKEYDSGSEDDEVKKKEKMKEEQQQHQEVEGTEVAILQNQPKLVRRLSNLSGISGLSGIGSGLFSPSVNCDDIDSDGVDSDEEQVEGEKNEEVEIDFSKIEVLHVDDTLEPEVDHRSNPFMKDLTIDVANMDDDIVNDGASVDDAAGRPINRGFDIRDAPPPYSNDYKKQQDHGEFSGMIITPDHQYDHNMDFTQQKFGKMLLCGVLSVCILGAFAFLMSVTNFGAVDTRHHPTVDPPIAYLDVTLPHEIDVHFADWNHHDTHPQHDIDATTRTDVPIFWSIPLTGNDVIEEYLGGCLGLTQASEVGIIGNVDDKDDASLKEVKVHGLSYINVDLRTRHGIDHATRLHLIDDHKNGDLSLTPDVVHTPLLYESAQLFENPNVNQGKIVTILRDPMERAVALYQQIVTSQSYTKSAAGGGYMMNLDEEEDGSKIMTLADYAQSEYVENNWLTRTLCNKPSGTLTERDLEMAKELLRRKVLVGLYDNVPLALSYFKHKFEWSNKRNNKHHLNQQRERRQLKRRSLVTTVEKGGDFTKDDNYYFSHCTTIGVEEALKKESEGWLWMKSQQYLKQRERQDQRPLLAPGSYAWTLLRRENEFDIELYEYAKTVHEYQFSSYRHRGMSKGWWRGN